MQNKENEMVARDSPAGAGWMDRRRFLKKAAVLAAGSCFGCSFAGCEADVIVPCLGPASAPEMVAGMTYLTASAIGCALDCNLATGRSKHNGGAATDDGPRINAAMAAATANHPITLIIDGAALVSGLFLPAGGYWSIAGLGCGTGFFVKTGTNNDGIHNGPPNAAVPSDPGPPAPSRGTNVSLSNFTVNGNRGNGSNGNSTTGLPQGRDGELWYFGINLMNLDNIVLQNIVVINTSSFCIRLSNVGNVTVSGCWMQTQTLSQDGLHFDGPANDIAISKCLFQTGDDSIALNCPEGYSGNISRVTVTGCTFSSWTLMRLYTFVATSTNQFSIDSVSVSNCTGVLSESAFLIGINNSGRMNATASLSISDCTLTAPALLGMADNFGSIALSNVIFNANLSQVIWGTSAPNRDSGLLRPSPLYGGTFYGSSLSIENCVINRNSNLNVAAVILENGSTIDTVTINGLVVQDAGAYPAVPGLVNIGSKSIGQLVLSSVNSQNIQSASAGGFSNIGSVSGAGVLATGWEFPDAVMANGVPYLSADSDMPSIKAGGVVTPYHP